MSIRPISHSSYPAIPQTPKRKRSSLEEVSVTGQEEFSPMRPNIISPIHKRFKEAADAYRAYQSPSGILQLDLDPDDKNKENVIYVFRDSVTGLTYVGKTNQLLKKRFSQHTYLTNHEERDEAQQLIYQMLRDNPENVEYVHIPCRAGTTLEEFEKELIKRVPPERLLNKNCGGGGGTTAKRVSSLASLSLPPPITYDAPERHRFYRHARTGRIRVAWSSPLASKTQNVIYQILNHKTGESKIGMTGQTLSHRISEYTSAARNATKKNTNNKGKDRLSVALEQHPEDFSVAILAQGHTTQLRALEREYIQKEHSLKNGYNQNRGGGGSSPSLQSQLPWLPL